MKQALFTSACIALLLAPEALSVRDRNAAAAKEAKDAKDAAAKEELAVPSVVPPYVLKNRSKFESPAPTARVPFWPVGWSKTAQAAPTTSLAAAATPEPKVTLDEKSFHVSSILISSGTAPSLAVINGRAYGEGEFLRMPKGSSVRIRVQRINDGTVTLEHADQKLVVPLRRPELNQHKPDSDVLNTDR